MEVHNFEGHKSYTETKLHNSELIYKVKENLANKNQRITLEEGSKNGPAIIIKRSIRYTPEEISPGYLHISRLKGGGPTNTEQDDKTSPPLSNGNVKKQQQLSSLIRNKKEWTESEKFAVEEGWKAPDTELSEEYWNSIDAVIQNGIKDTTENLEKILKEHPFIDGNNDTTSIESFNQAIFKDNCISLDQAKVDTSVIDSADQNEISVIIKNAHKFRDVSDKEIADCLKNTPEFSELPSSRKSVVYAATKDFYAKISSYRQLAGVRKSDGTGVDDIHTLQYRETLLISGKVSQVIDQGFRFGAVTLQQLSYIHRSMSEFYKLGESHRHLVEFVYHELMGITKNYRDMETAGASNQMLYSVVHNQLTDSINEANNLKNSLEKSVNEANNLKNSLGKCQQKVENLSWKATITAILGIAVVGVVSYKIIQALFPNGIVDVKSCWESKTPTIEITKPALVTAWESGKSLSKTIPGQVGAAVVGGLALNTGYTQHRMKQVIEEAKETARKLQIAEDALKSADERLAGLRQARNILCAASYFVGFLRADAIRLIALLFNPSSKS